MPRFAKLRDDLISSQSLQDKQKVFTLKDPITQQYFRLREPEFWLINQLDGKTSLTSIADRFQEKFQLNISPENVQEFVDSLEKLMFLENSRSEQAISRTSYAAAAERSLASRIFYLKIKAFKPGKLLDLLTRLYRPFHRGAWFALEVLLILFGLGLLWANFTHFSVSIDQIYSVSSIATIVVSLFVLVTLHEFAHAVMCRYYGGQVSEIGFLLMYFQPCFYCNLSDAWLFEKKRHRLAVTFAGPFFQLVLLALAVIVWRITVPGTAINEVSRVVAVVSWVSYLFNFNPLIKLDGYYLLSDWLDIPNLRRKSFRFLGNVIQRRLLGWPVEAVSVTRREVRIFSVYSVLAVIYTGLLVGYILYIVGQFLLHETGVAGLILLFAVLVIIFRQSIGALARGLVRHIGYMKQLLKKPVRLVIYGLVLLLILVVFLAVPFTHRVTGDVILQPISEFSLSVNELGLLESNLGLRGEKPENRSSYLQMASNEMAALDLVPLVQNGQEVRKGDTVAMLTSNQMTREIARTQAELDRLEGELALLNAPPKEEEVAEATAEVTAAQAHYEQSVRDFQRVERLVEQNLDTSEKLESARTAVDIAKAELTNKTSRLRLLQSPPRPEEVAVLVHSIHKQKAHRDFLQQQAEAQMIITPIGGTVLARTDNSEVLRITSISSIEVAVPVSDYDITLVSIGQPAKVKVRSYPGKLFSGSVVRVPNLAGETEDNPQFRVSVVLDNADGYLQAGMSGYAKIEVGNASLAGLIGRRLMSMLRVEFWSWW